MRQGDSCDPQGWYGEETLDVEAVHAMAPGASIVYAGAKSCFDHVIDVALNKLVDHELVDLVSNSYGNLGEDIPGTVKEFDAIANQAAATGIGLYFSSGDSGDEATNLGHPETDFSASSHHVTAVGGTSLGVGANGKTVVEQGWSSTTVGQDPEGVWAGRPPGDFLYGSGGGTSRLYREPAYQKGVVPDALAKAWSNKPGRVVPDISMVGDPNTGMLDRSDADVLRRRLLRPVPDRWHEPLVAAVRRRDGGGRPGRGLLPRLRQPAAVQPVRHEGVQRREAGSKTAVVRRNFVNSENADDGFATSARLFDVEVGTLHVTKGYDNMTGIGTPNGRRSSPC